MIAAILLAAGQSRRMGQNKLLLPFGDKTVVECSVEALLHAKVEETIVVIGHEAKRLRARLARYPVRCIENKNYAEGMSRSLRAGLDAVDARATAVLVALADQPLVGTEEINRLIETYQRTGKKIVAPVFDGRRGHPVLFDIALKEAMRRLTGDVGARAILAAHPEMVELVPMPTDRTLLDMDNPDDYQALARKPAP